MIWRKTEWDSTIAGAAEKYKLPEWFIRAVIWAESAFDPKAVSSCGAIGLMQLMPKTAKWLGVDPADPRQNIDGGVRYLQMMFKKFGTLELALAAYNAGPGHVEEYHGIPPFEETQNYVKKIMAWKPERTCPTCGAVLD